ncbi:cell division protein FtsL [Rhodoferax sp.]|uniref:cell division protein FtsL n=1 Tax=Rhodoferax sp. TaxID=50421 RepID=UPI0008D26BC1|nr:cell division protein FtsL [Rhodoferax sp.]MDO8321196.1 cell division protein FtsL [Rhodoferax sp.]OGB82144.1 MAG: cell division protein FtsL [Burkholderiales bacterium RIFOXYD2_FULL_59_8]OGB82754.1 MAG: cell division protein FtsL [Burkholderiales bacterium RIFOXYC12_FULL_60_6]
MMRLNLVLLLGVLLSALYLVNVQYESRRVYSELDRAKSQALKLAAENERLQVEKRAQATSARIESLASSKLQMRSATPAVTTYVSYASGASAPGLPISAAGERLP